MAEKVFPPGVIGYEIVRRRVRDPFGMLRWQEEKVPIYDTSISPEEPPGDPDLLTPDQYMLQRASQSTPNAVPLKGAKDD